MSFTRFAEIGRVVMINYGPDYGKLATIIDVIDQNRALIDGSHTAGGVRRQSITFRRLALTDFKVKIGLNAGEKALKKAWAKADIQTKWNATSWAKRLAAREAKANTTDFARFKQMIARKKVTVAVNTAVKKLKKSA